MVKRGCDGEIRGGEKRNVKKGFVRREVQGRLTLAERDKMDERFRALEHTKTIDLFALLLAMMSRQAKTAKSCAVHLNSQHSQSPATAESTQTYMP